MSCMSGAIADFVGRDLTEDSANLVVASGGDAFVRSSVPLDVYLYAQGSPMHEQLVLSLPTFKKCFGISTFVPGKGIHSVTVISRSACWACAFATDIGTRIAEGERLSSVLDRAENYTDVGGVVVIAGATIVVGGDMVLRSANGSSSGYADRE